MTGAVPIGCSLAVVSATVGLLGGSPLAQQEMQLANPASQRCLSHGGSLQIEQRPDGGQFGVCVFADNRQCEEWAMFRGDCPDSGVRVTGYVTQAARFCAIAGGRYAEQNVCTFPGGRNCDADAFLAGTCGRP